MWWDGEVMGGGGLEKGGKEEEAEKRRADGEINHYPHVIAKYLSTQLLP